MFKESIKAEQERAQENSKSLKTFQHLFSSKSKPSKSSSFCFCCVQALFSTQKRCLKKGYIIRGKCVVPASKEHL